MNNPNVMTRRTTERLQAAIAGEVFVADDAGAATRFCAAGRVM